MKKIGVFLAQGFEEIEGLTVVDILRRAGVEVATISIMGSAEVCGSHNIPVIADTLYEAVDFESLDGVVLPGGLEGTTNLGAHAGVNETICSVITSRGMGTSIAFALRLAAYLTDEDRARELAEKIIYRQ